MIQIKITDRNERADKEKGFNKFLLPLLFLTHVNQDVKFREIKCQHQGYNNIDL